MTNVNQVYKKLIFFKHHKKTKTQTREKVNLTKDNNNTCQTKHRQELLVLSFSLLHFFFITSINRITGLGIKMWY